MQSSEQCACRQLSKQVVRIGACVRRPVELLLLVVLQGVVLGAPGEARADDAKDVTSELDQLSLEQLMQVRISPFDVSTRQDRGYQAFSSVTGSRLDTPIKELPFPIQVFTSRFIEDQKAVTIFDVATYAPSVTYRSNDFNEGNANLAIRGFAIGSSPNAVQTLRDGFHGPPIFEFTNVSRLEIVKGPASFLYGQLAPGGIVNVITKTPQPDFGSYAKLRFGSYGSRRFEGDVTGPLLRGLLFRVVSSADQDIHYWKPYDARSFALASALRWQPSQSATLTVKHELYRKRESPQLMQKPGYGRQSGVVPTSEDPNLSGVAVPGLPDDWNGLATNDFRNSDTNSVSATLDVAADEHWDLRAAYAHQNHEIGAVFTGNFGLANDLPFSQGRRFRRQTYSNSEDTFGLDATGRYGFGFGSLRLLLGAQYNLREFDAVADQAPNDPQYGPVASPLPNWDLRDPTTWDRASLPLSSIPPLASRPTRFRDRAAFAGTTLGFFDSRLLMLSGVRLTVAESLTTDSDREFRAHRYTPQYGVLYALSSGWSLFATYSESFVPAAVMLQERNVETRPARPTTGRGFDVGTKFDLFNGRLSGTATVFDVRNTDILYEVAELDASIGQQVFTRQQSGEQRCSGFELDATLSPIDDWQTYLSYSYNYARIVEHSGQDARILAAGPSAPGYKEVALFHGAPLQMSAPHLANLWTRYDVSSGELRDIYLAAGTHLVFDQTLLPDTPARFRQTYALLNAMIGKSLELGTGLDGSVEVWGKNLTDRRYRPSQSTRSRPREVGIEVSVRH